MRTATIIAAVRTPIGRYAGALAPVRPDDLAALVIKTVVERSGIDPALIDDLYLGDANQAGEDNRNVARMAALLAGLPETAPGCTVNRLCASGLEAVNIAARMIEGGEDPMYIARRIVHHAAEDIGLADPQALVVATAAAHATHLIGLPEARLTLAEAAAYLARAPKSNKVCLAYEAAAEDARATQTEPVPLHLRNAPTGLMKGLGYGKGYQYAHDYEEGKTEMVCLPEKLKGRKYFQED